MLAGGTPGFDSPTDLNDLAIKYIRRGHNQYTVNRGGKRLREVIARIWEEPLGRLFDSDTEVTVTCGATEGLLAATMAVIDPGDRVLVMEPFYENYRSIALLSNGKPVYVPLIPPDWEPDWQILEEQADGAKLIIINSPHNPTGSVLSGNVLKELARIAVENDLFVISDETYRTMVYDLEEPNSICSFPGMTERTAVIGSFSKNMTATGWRVGYVIASKKYTSQLRKVHDFASICAPAPFQDAIAEFWNTSEYDGYFKKLISDYRCKRDTIYDALLEAGFKLSIPRGAYYILADFSEIKPELDDLEMVRYMAGDIGIGVIGGRAFFDNNDRARRYIRISFSQEIGVIEEAARRIRLGFR